MDTFDCIATKLDSRQFSPQPVSSNILTMILDAARLTGSGLNSQHWRFIVIRKQDNLKRLAQDSTSGAWVEGANFAVIVLTNPEFGFHLIDAGRVSQSMQLAAWNKGIASGIYTGVKEEKLRSDFKIPSYLYISLILGFGYPKKPISGKGKNRLPLEELVYEEVYG
ncbi:MAG: nitroreductase family protein [Thermoproteota archaeon]|nr:nitroreductase family protein [Thermoproteota archaeon]